ncbi:hypothetical protein LCGC14_1746460 [marine sediment metagenome]|uniref:Uncharacterized protein n=1 Tax=marine sediment metagenome TaxID=412755 RepID=A0A0F9H3W5_9ZZZZ
MEKWKSIICDSDKCISEMFIPENMRAADNSLNDMALQKYKIYPDVDTEELTQFTCRRCGKVTAWGPTQRSIHKQLHERYN